MTNTNKKLNKYINSVDLVNTIIGINEKYNLPDGYIAGLIYDLIDNKKNYNKIDDDIKKNFKRSDIESKEIAVEILGKLILCIEKDIKKDIKKIIENLGGRPNEYFDDAKELYNKIYPKKEIISKRVSKSAEEEIIETSESPEEEKVSCESLLKNDFLTVLEEKDTELIDMLNFRILNLMINHPDYIPDFERSLLENSQKITNEKIDLEGKDVDPTIANWLLDFISRVGIDNITTITQSKYLTDSKNAKNLTFEERKKLSKLLEFYRRFKHFPESLEKLPPNEWGLIPVETKPKGKFEKKETIEKTPETNKQAQSLKQKYDAITDKKSLEAKAIAEEIKRLGG